MPVPKGVDKKGHSIGLGPMFKAKHPEHAPERNVKAWAELDAYLQKHPEETEVLTRTTEHLFGPRVPVEF